VVTPRAAAGVASTTPFRPATPPFPCDARECLAIPGWVPYIRADTTVSNADDGASGAAGRREAGVSAWEARS
jgi:hypothetical protein